MRKVWMISLVVTVLSVVMAIPALAAVPNDKSCNNNLWSRLSGSAVTQPAVPSIPNNGAAGNCDAKASTKCSGPACNAVANGIAQQVKTQVGQNCANGNCNTNSSCLKNACLNGNPNQTGIRVSNCNLWN